MHFATIKCNALTIIRKLWSDIKLAEALLVNMDPITKDFCHDPSSENCETLSSKWDEGKDVEIVTNPLLSLLNNQ